jgi:hypothetical protein
MVNATDGCTYTISDAHVVLDTHILNDSSANSLDKLSAGGGLQYTFNAYEASENVFSSTRLHLEQTKSIGLATEVMLVSRLTDNVQDDQKDSMLPQNFANGIQTLQMRSNSAFFPSLPTSSSTEQYLNTVDGLADKTDYTLADYENATVGAIIRQRLETSDAVGKASGLPISASSALRVSGVFAAAANRTTTLFVEHIAIVTAILFDSFVMEI